MLKIWGRPNSINVKKVLWCADELGLRYEQIDAGMQYGVVNTPEFRKLNPNGKVPAIEDDGFVLWESHAIVRYLAAKHGAGTLWPDDLRVRADADRWMDWASGTLGVPYRTVFWTLVRTPPEKRDMQAVEDCRRQCAELLDMVEVHLSGRSYLAGGQLTIGDIPLGCHVHVWLSLPIERPAHPNIVAWHRRLLQRPGYAKWIDMPIS